MKEAKTLLEVEADFSKILDALSLSECQQNRRLRAKTKVVVRLLRRLAPLRKELEQTNSARAERAN